MANLEQFTAFLQRLKSESWDSEADVAHRLIDPCLTMLGWGDRSVAREMWIDLTPEMANLWKYPSRRMRRDYVLNSRGHEVVHLEAKHNWPRHRLDMAEFLSRANRGDWTGTEMDGERKDLALLLWGAESRGVPRTALMDNHRLMIFDWSAGWQLASEEELFETPLESAKAATKLLTPEAFSFERVP
jgi:hypothetical protein